MKILLLALMAVSAASAVTAAPAISFGSRSTVTLAVKPEFTRPGGQPGAMREIAPEKPVKRRRAKGQP